MVFPPLFIGSAEIIFVIFIIVIVFGADKVPEIARGLGKAIRSVKNASSDIQNEITQSAEKHFDESGGKEIKEEVDKVKDDIEDVTGSIKRRK